jgi:predicted nucleic acid-binding protein
MSNKVFVDTNILLYGHERSAGAKYDRARSLIEKLWESGGGILSTQVLQELCVNLRRKTARPLSAECTRELL